jgi:DNA-binding beta-propeller fold protein YncE
MGGSFRFRGMSGIERTLYRRNISRALGTVSACGLLAVTGCGSSASHTSTAAKPRPAAVRKLVLGGAPIGLLAYGGQLWVADAQGNRLLRVAPASGRVTGQVAVGRTPLRIVAFRGSLWSTDFRAGTVSQVSPTGLRRLATIHVGPQPEGIVAFGPELWIVSQQSGELVRVVPGDSRPASRIPVGDQPRQVTAGGGFLWVSVFGDNEVAEVNPRTRRLVARIQACVGPQGIAYAAGRIWVACTNDGVFAAIDRATRRVVRRIAYNAADAVTDTGSELHVTSDSGPSTAVLDPQTGGLTHNVKLSDAFIGDANADVVSAGGAIWVSSPDESAVYRVPADG